MIVMKKKPARKPAKKSSFLSYGHPLFSVLFIVFVLIAAVLVFFLIASYKVAKEIDEHVTVSTETPVLTITPKTPPFKK